MNGAANRPTRHAAGLFRIGQQQAAKLLAMGDIWSHPNADALAQLLRRASSEPEMLHGITATLSAALQEAPQPGHLPVDARLDAIAEAAGFAPNRAAQLPALPPGCELVSSGQARRPRASFTLERFHWGDIWRGSAKQVASIGIVALDRLPGNPGRASCREVIEACAIDAARCLEALGFVATKIGITRNGGRFTMRVSASGSEQALRGRRTGTAPAPALVAIIGRSRGPCSNVEPLRGTAGPNPFRLIAGGRA